MATIIGKLWSKLSSKQPPISLMIIGLDDSGKTSIVNTLTALSSSSFSSASTAAGTIKRTLDDSANNNNVSLNRPNQPLNTSMTGGTSVASAGQGTSANVSPTIGYNYERIRYRNRTINLLDFSGQSKYRGLWQEFFNCVDGIVFVIDSSDLIRLVVAQDELETLLSHPYFATLTPNAPDDTGGGGSAAGNTFSSGQPIAAQHLAQRQVVIDQGKLIQSPLSDWLKAAPRNRPSSRDGLGGGRRTKVPMLFLANKSDLATSIDTQAIKEALKLEHAPKERHPWHIQATSVRTNQGIVDGLNWILDEILSERIDRCKFP